MIGILMAGGMGKRLQPATNVISKHLFPIYDKPMIYYSMSIFFMAKIKDIIIVADASNLENYKKMFGNGKKFGIKINYVIQSSPGGIAEGILLSERLIKGKRVCLVLGDNILYGNGLSAALLKAKKNVGATIFAYYVDDPSSYGVITFDKNGKPNQIIEKPKKLISNYAIPGIYFYDKHILEITKSTKKSSRNELEISTVNQLYLTRGNLNTISLNRGYAWLDTGTVDNLNAANNFVATIEKRQGLKISCLEEIAYRNKWITKEGLNKHIRNMSKDSDYALYLKKIISEI